MKMLRIVEFMWVMIAAVSIYEAYANWNIDRTRALMFLAFLALAIFMYFFRRRTRLRYEEKNNSDQNQ